MFKNRKYVLHRIFFAPLKCLQKIAHSPRERCAGSPKYRIAYRNFRAFKAHVQSNCLLKIWNFSHCNLSSHLSPNKSYVRKTIVFWKLKLAKSSRSCYRLIVLTTSVQAFHTKQPKFDSHQRQKFLSTVKLHQLQNFSM